ncbi:MAG: sec-independent translocase [Nocardioidaceae bacterium]
MFGIGLPELTVIIIVAVVVFGPDRLPEFARQAGRMVRQIRKFTQAARDDIRAELGPEFADFELSDLDPRKAVRKHILEAWEEDDEPAQKRPGQRPLQTGERPPYDADAT